MTALIHMTHSCVEDIAREFTGLDFAYVEDEATAMEAMFGCRAFSGSINRGADNVLCTIWDNEEAAVDFKLRFANQIVEPHVKTEAEIAEERRQAEATLAALCAQQQATLNLAKINASAFNTLRDNLATPLDTGSATASWDDQNAKRHPYIMAHPTGFNYLKGGK